MKELFNLGELYVSDFLSDGDEPRGGKVEMKLILDENTGNVRLEKSAPLDVMYGKYWYRSGINQSMRNELQRIVNSILDVKKLKENDIIKGTKFDKIELCMICLEDLEYGIITKCNHKFHLSCIYIY